jgi:ABC-type phosphate transport system auxiliary subunit
MMWSKKAHYYCVLLSDCQVSYNRKGFMVVERNARPNVYSTIARFQINHYVQSS